MFRNFFQNRSLKIDLFILLFFLFTILIIFRLYFLQIKEGEKFKRIVLNSKNYYIQDENYDRGKIYFQNKNNLIPVALQSVKYILFIDNSKNLFIKSNKIKDVYQKLSKIIKIDYKSFEKKAKEKNNGYIVIKRKLDEKEKKEIQKLKIKGIYLKKESLREYPANDVALNVIGRVNRERKGVFGLEAQFDSILKRVGEKNVKEELLDIFFKPFNENFKKPVVFKTGDIISSIDLNLQSYLEKILEDINQKYHSKKTLGIIIKPYSGEIIAIATTDKNYLGAFSITQTRYEPGSIIKPLIVAIALDSGSINKDFSYNDTGCLFVKAHKVCNYDKKARGANTNLVKIIGESLNVGMVKIQQQIKYNVFFNYFLKFKMGEETGIDLPNEISQNISSLDYKVPISYAAAAFGQGVSFTPISMLRSLSIIANDGYVIRPHIIKKINYNNPMIPDDEIEIKKEKVLKNKTIWEIQKIMLDAVNSSPSKLKYKPKGYTVAAKTGTAQIADKIGGYKEGANLHTFFGFFPVKVKPEDRYAIILYTFEPQAKYSSQTLTKPFFDIMKFLINYYDIKPDNL